MDSTQIALVCFDDKEEMAVWSHEQGICKALTHGQRKRMSRSLNAMTTFTSENASPVWKLVSPEFDVSVFQSTDEAMAILDPLRSELLWENLKGHAPKKLAIFPSCTKESSRVASDVAEWQDACGKSFVILFEGGSIDDELGWLCELGDWVRQDKDGVHYVSNDQKMLQEVFDFPQNHEAHQDEVSCFHQNHEAHQDEVASIRITRRTRTKSVASVRITRRTRCPFLILLRVSTVGPFTEMRVSTVGPT